MVVDFSEPDGFFRSDNFISNETTFQDVIPELQEAHRRRTACTSGVGPDQNFTYIAALRPRIAFIVDIRRQNMLLHLMYKALIEMSADRADFLSRLFSRPRPAGLDQSTPPRRCSTPSTGRRQRRALFANEPPGDARSAREATHGFALIDATIANGIEYVYRAFSSSGPDLRYSFPRSRSARRMVSDLRGADGGDRSARAEPQLPGDRRELPRAAASSQRNNLIVPLVGDFGGDKAIRAVGQLPEASTAPRSRLLHVERRAVSVPERRLAEVLRERRHPADRRRTARSSAPTSTWGSASPGIITPDLHSVQLLDPIDSLLTGFQRRRVPNYDELIARTKF